jgi:hypothetical protein
MVCHRSPILFSRLDRRRRPLCFACSALASDALLKVGDVLIGLGEAVPLVEPRGSLLPPDREPLVAEVSYQTLRSFQKPPLAALPFFVGG